MKNGRLSFFSADFAKNALTLVSGSVVGQAIALLIYPLLTRLFSTEDLGVYATWLSVVDVLVLLSTGRYESGIMLSRDKSEASATASLAKRINFVFFAASAVVVTVIFLLGATSGIVFLIPPMVYLCGTSKVYSSLLNYLNKYKPIALSEIINSVTASVTKLVCGFLRFTTGTLPASNLLGQAFANLNYRLQLHKQPFPKAERSQVRQMAKKHRNFPLYTLPKDFINSFSHNLPFMLLAIYFNQAYIGLFSLAITSAFRPINIISSAFDRVLYKRLADKHNSNQSFVKDLKKFVGGNVLLFLPLFALIFIFADNIIEILFGSTWISSAVYLRYIMPWIFLNLFGSSLSFMPYIFSAQRTEMIIMIVQLVLRLIALGIGIVLNNFDLAILLFAIVSAVVIIIRLCWYASMVRIYEKKLKTA